MQAFIIKNIFGVCVIDDSLKQKDDEYLTNSYFRLSPITVGFILFHELLQVLAKRKHWSFEFCYSYGSSCYMPNLHFFLILDNLTWLGKVRNKLLKQLLPSKLRMPSTLTKRGLGAGSIVILPQL